MGHYLSQPQSSTHSLGYAFAAQYKRDHGPGSAVSTQEVSNVLQDAYNYKQLHSKLELLLEDVQHLHKEELIDALHDILEKAPPVQTVYPSKVILRELQEAIMHLRQLLQSKDQDLSAQRRIEASLYAAEHSIDILEKENQDLQDQLQNKEILIKQVHQEAQKIKQAFSGKNHQLEPIVENIHTALDELEKAQVELSPQIQTTLQKLEEQVAEALNTLRH